MLLNYYQIKKQVLQWAALDCFSVQKLMNVTQQ